MSTHRVKATREGQISGITASGLRVCGWSIGDPLCRGNFFCALPSRRTLGRIVEITNPVNGRSVTCAQEDVGPWNTADDDYVLDASGTIRPQAETGTDQRGHQTNGAGIDLSEAVWGLLGMTDNGPVEWRFL